MSARGSDDELCLRIAVVICEVFHPGARHDLPMMTCTKAVEAARQALAVVRESTGNSSTGPVTS